MSFRSWIVILLICILIIKAHLMESWQWSWTCNATLGYCVKSKELALNTQQIPHSQKLCRLICGPYGALWPAPTISTTFARERFVYFHPSEINFKFLQATEDTTEFLQKISHIFIYNLELECGPNCNIYTGANITIYIETASQDTTLSLDTDESYSLEIVNEPTIRIKIDAETVFGARHALETISQLITSYQIKTSGEPRSGLLMVATASIKDKPIYRHRGLLIDTARNYLPIQVIKKQIDTMAASKLNVLHWHATDSQSFPIVSQRVPQFSKFGAYSNEEVYYLSDIRKLLAYAKYRGIRILLEIDSPSHAGNGWQWGPSEGVGNLAVCVNQMPWKQYCIQPPCGQLNPANPNLYFVLQELYKDIVDVFPKGEFFHMGGDEVYIPCWNSTEEVVKYMEQEGLGRNKEGFLNLWSEFQAKALYSYDNILGTNTTPIVVWSSQLTDPDIIERYLPKNRYVIQTWVPKEDRIPEELLEKGYRLIMSTKNAWYLDHGFWGNTSYYTWRSIYANRILRHKNVLGGEICMWGELVDSNSIEPRIWPRAAAFAERLWSDPATDILAVEARFYRHRERLITRGVQAEALTPGWCYQNEREC